MTDDARPQHLVETPQQLEPLVAAVAAEAEVALDTESNGFHAYFERVCLLQVATSAADWAVDAIALDRAALAPLTALLADPRREVILHAAEYDVLCLKREYGLTLGHIFDTHAAAKTLGVERVGLGDLLEGQLGVKLTADEQRSDWGKRPLSKEQLEYAFADVRHLLALRRHLGVQLAEKGLVAEAEAEFARLIAKEPRAREFDPEGWQRMKASRTLDGKGRAVLRALFLLRDARARQLNRPPFKVLSDLFLYEVARRLPKTEEELVRVPGASAGQVRRVAEGVLAAVAEGLAAAPLPKPRGGGGRPRPGQGPGQPPPEVLERYEKLRAWRKLRAAARAVEVQVIAPNAVLMAIAQQGPSSLEGLAGVTGMDPFRLQQYGAEMLAALAAGAPPAPSQPAAEPPTAPAAQGKLFE